MNELTRREFLQSIGIATVGLSIPVSIQTILKPFAVQVAYQNYLTLQSGRELLVAEVRAIGLDKTDEGYLPVVFEDSFNLKKLLAFAHKTASVRLDLYNGVPMMFEGAGTILHCYRVTEGNCIDIGLENFRCLTTILTNISPLR